MDGVRDSHAAAASRRDVDRHSARRAVGPLVAILMHASLTTSMIILGPAVNGADSVVYNLVFATTLWGIVGLTTRARGKRDLVRPRRPIEQRDLLPDLAGEPSDQRLDLIHGAQHHRIVEVLDE